MEVEVEVEKGGVRCEEELSSSGSDLRSRYGM
jgi:hypothetical protein